MATIALTLRQLILQATQRLKAAGCETPRLDAEILWMHISGDTATGMIIHANENVEYDSQRSFEALVLRRLQREPVAYIVEEKEFWGRSFHVTPDVLIPRPETEHMIEWLLATIPDQQQACSLLDVGTGSGCLAISIACEYPQAQLVACDISLPALRVAKANAMRHGVAERIRFVCGDLLQAISAKPSFDAILSNPPYVSQQAMNDLAPELDYEPQSALTDHHDGLQCMRSLLQSSVSRLYPGGWLCIESGLSGYIHKPENGMQLHHTYDDLSGRFRGVVYHLSR